jgi:hypothetical protein
MQGSLDQPPIVICTSAVKSGALMIGCAAAAALCWFLLSWQPLATTHADSGLVAFGLAVPYYGWLFVSPNVLTLSPDGLTVKTRWRKAEWSWDQVSNFRAVRVGIYSQQVAFDLEEGAPAPAWFMQYYVRYAGADDSLGGAWELDPAELAGQLNSARERWKAARRWGGR